MPWKRLNGFCLGPWFKYTIIHLFIHVSTFSQFGVFGQEIFTAISKSMQQTFRMKISFYLNCLIHCEWLIRSSIVQYFFRLSPDFCSELTVISYSEMTKKKLWGLLWFLYNKYVFVFVTNHIHFYILLESMAMFSCINLKHINYAL